jgi:arylsulfatase A-like enzyme
MDHRILVIAAAMAAALPLRSEPPPSIIFILADDLGYAELGCYGQKKILTPNIDRLAAEGMRFTQFYAGSTVCAPSRCVLMTGLHTGHARVRGNAGRRNPGPQTLRPEDVTVAEVLKTAGYATGLIGKWGLGDEPDGTGHPKEQGFDEFFGYLSQHHAHNHFPDYLWRNRERVPLPNVIVPVGDHGAGYATERVNYAGDLFAEEALAFVERHRSRPFFLYLSVVVPHANNERRAALGDGQEVPDYGPYAGEDWSPQMKGQAAMVTRLDADVGRLLAKLRDLGIERRTLVVFSSDNGPHKEGGHDPDLFDPNGPLRGFKRDLAEGGIRVPLIASWPGTIAPGGVSAHVGYFGDFLATAAELAGAATPAGLDAISFAPALLGRGEQRRHQRLYWEFHEGGSSQAVLLDGRWKGMRLKRRGAPIQLYDLENDIGEERDLAASRQDLVAQVEKALVEERRDSADWPLKDAPEAKKAAMPRVRISDDGRGFVLEGSGAPFAPRGFNYDHDRDGRLIEDYWEAEWPSVEADFEEMKALGANVVRVHLQTGKFLSNASAVDAAAISRLGRLLDLAERVGLYLDITGLGCYHRADVPAWYDALDEAARWAAQARFWEAVAERGAASPAVFCYDLMNEPVVPGGPKRSDWLGPAFAGKHFVQFITLEAGERRRQDIARDWVRRLARAIRSRDPRGLITVGLVPWSLDRPGLNSGFFPEAFAADLDFLSVHLYPEPGKLEEDLATLRGFALGKPLLLEETFPLRAPMPDFERFLDAADGVVAGWVGFYWGKTIDELRASTTFADAMLLGWLECFQRRTAKRSTER